MGMMGCGCLGNWFLGYVVVGGVLLAPHGPVPSPWPSPAVVGCLRTRMGRRGKDFKDGLWLFGGLVLGLRGGLGSPSGPAPPRTLTPGPSPAERERGERLRRLMVFHCCSVNFPCRYILVASQTCQKRNTSPHYGRIPSPAGRERARVRARGRVVLGGLIQHATPSKQNSIMAIIPHHAHHGSNAPVIVSDLVLCFSVGVKNHDGHDFG